MKKSPHCFSILRNSPKNSVEQQSNRQVCHCVKQRVAPRTELLSALFQECIFSASSCSASEENHFPRARLWRFCEHLSPILAFEIDFEEELVNVCLLLKSEEEWKKISHNFKSYANFPYSLGCLDGKHIHITRNSLQ